MKTKTLKPLLGSTLLGIALLLGSCNAPQNNKLQDGIWRAELSGIDNKQVPFLFEVQNAATDSAIVTLLNGEERVPLAGIRYVADTVIIPIDAYDAVLQAKILGDKLEGRFIKNYIEGDTGVVFHAQKGISARFEPAATPTTIAIDGKWDIAFIGAENDTTHNVGIFQSANGIVTGSVLTNSGDLRFLEGVLTENGVQLSAFSGLSPYLIEISFADDNAFNGVFYTTRSKTTLAGTRNNSATLNDAYNLTKLKKGFDRLGFKLPNTDGMLISLNDDRYKGKVVIVTILGSWCPNCLDETKFLVPWYKENKARGVEIIGLAFERKSDAEYGKAAINRLKKQYGIEYEVLFGGQANSNSIAQVLPEIDKLSSYPTTFFIDKQGKVQKIHTGFDGPATGSYYEEFKKEFDAVVEGLLK